MFQTGARAEWSGREDRQVTLQGDFYREDAGQRSALTSYTAPFSSTVNDPARLWGANALARLEGGIGRLRNVRLQVSFDATSRKEPTFAEMRNDAFRSESLVAYEDGYRVNASNRWQAQTAFFINQHDDVLSTESGTVFLEDEPAPAHVIQPLVFANGLNGTSYGAEIDTDIRPTDWSRLQASYSYLRIEMSRQEGSRDLSQEVRDEGLSPRPRCRSVAPSIYRKTSSSM